MYRLDSISEKLAVLGKDPGGPPDGSPRAAVAAIFRALPEDGGAELFFIQRAERERDPWSGHIAFPGGRREATDATLLDTAIRETREEVGIDLSGAELLARLPDVPAFTRTKRGLLVVTPFVFAVREPIIATPNEEVASTLWVPFVKLAHGEGKGTFRWVWDEKELDLPCIRLDPGQHVLWGMTYRMLETLLEALLPDPPPGEIAGG
jgi:8-oxo-dGTP pyrophosphatase MutT (NUDIX family)